MKKCSYTLPFLQTGQEHRVRLANLKSTEYEVEVRAEGTNQSSPPLTVTFDMACGSIKVDVILLLDTST